MKLNGKIASLIRLKSDPYFGKIIPPFLIISLPCLTNSSEDFEMYRKFIDEHGITILRSALYGEGNQEDSGQLLSGKSISCLNIDNIDLLQAEIKKIVSSSLREQKAVEIILQKQIVNYKYHLTVYYENGFKYLQCKDMDTGKQGFVVLTSETVVGDVLQLKNISCLNSFFDIWDKNIGLSGVIFEMALSITSDNEELFLFQATTIPSTLVHRIFNNDVFKHLLMVKSEWEKSQSFFKMLKTEMMAYRFRKKFKQNDECKLQVSLSFNNWRYLYHYYFLFCKMKRKQASSSSFAQFISLVYLDNGSLQIVDRFLIEQVKKHISIANKCMINNSFASFNNAISNNVCDYIYIGNGSYHGTIDIEIVVIENILPEHVYQLISSTKNAKIILTSSFELLSHAFLAAVENEIMVVANIPKNTLNQLKTGDIIFVDFNNYKIVIEQKDFLNTNNGEKL